MSDITDRIEELSPEKRALLTMRLQQKRAETARERVIPRREDMNVYPMSYAQQRLWFLDQVEPNSPFYSVPTAIRLSGPLDVYALKRSLNEIVRRHEVLRASFPTEDGHPVQVIAPKLELSFPIIDLRHLPLDEREAEALRLATLEAKRPFDLSRGPLVRAGLLRMGYNNHIVLLTMHHIVFDGWSNGVLIQEVAALYNAYSSGRKSPLPELTIQYADYADWQRQWLAGEVFDTQLDYWKDVLGDHLPVLELPTDHPRPRVQTYNGAYYNFTFSKKQVEGLNVICRQEDTTQYMAFLAAFQTLLYRYTGQNDISVGSPIAGRNRKEIEGLIGMFINMLVMRTDLSGDPSYRELLQGVREGALSAQGNQDIPFEVLVDELQVPRDMSHSPLFQVSLVYQNAPMGALELGDMALNIIETDIGTAKYDLTLVIEEGDDALSGSFRFNKDIFDRSTIVRMSDHLLRLLDGIVANPDQNISMLPLLNNSEKELLLKRWNDTSVEYPPAESLVQLFEAQVERTPDAVAISFDGEDLTYKEFNRRANQLAYHLMRLGVGPEVLVGVYMERSFEMVIALYGILKAGGAYVPLDPEYPADRVAYMLDDTQIPVLLTQERLLASLPNNGAEVLCLDSDWTAISDEIIDNPVSQATAEDLAYVIYTSGSTGRPKGVMNNHRGIVNRILWMQDEYQLTEGDRVLQKTPFSFDVSVWEFFWPLLVGARLIVAQPGGHRDSGYLIKLIGEQKITTMHFVPSMLQLFLEDRDVELCTSLKRVICSGEALPYELQKRFFARLKAKLHNLYGPTEAAVDVSYWESQRESSLNTVPIGRPVANTQLYILDKTMQPVPIGVSGELHIGGIQVARGYLKRPELTSEKFIPDPYSDVPGARLYKTGDLTRFLPDGAIEFIGRIDFQVKLRGFRIELGEIESVLSQPPDILEVVVMLREDTPGDKRIAAYIVSQTQSSLNVSELRDYLSDKLPDYMIPSVFVLLEKMPLNTNGKIDRRALPVPESERPELKKAYVAPRNTLEAYLANMWQELLGINQVGVNDNFFELGGNSILGATFINRLQDTLGEYINMIAIFDSPTVSELAVYLEKNNTEGTARLVEALPATELEMEDLERSEMVIEQFLFGRGDKGSAQSITSINRIPRDGDLPLSFAQQRLWFLDHLEQGSAYYNIPSAVRLIGPLDISALERSFNEIVWRHETLRSTFPTEDGFARLKIVPELQITVQVIDLSDLPEDDLDPEVSRQVELSAQQPFDLAKGPLLRVDLLQVSPEDHVAILVMHHIISDGWSMGVLIRELVALYHAFSDQKPSPLPELSIQYVDYAEWQRGWLQGEVLEKQLTYWRTQLADSPALLELPTDRPRPSVLTSNGGHLLFTISRELTAALNAISKGDEGTLFMTLLTAFKILLYRYTGQEDISVGTPIANRNNSELEPLIGFFVNTLVLRTDLSGKPSFRELLKRVRKTAVGAYAHQDVPFEMLVDEIQPERNMSHTPLFQVTFAMQNTPAEKLELPGLTITPMDADSGTSKNDLSLSVVEMEGEIKGMFEYNSDLFDESSIERTIEHFQVLLEAIAADPDQRITSLPLMMPEEESRVIVEWNNTSTPFPDNTCVHHLIEEQVDRTPGATAIIYKDRSLTYDELNKKANQFAHYLRGKGVGPETPVGLCVERSPEMMVGMLGILKAGGAYVPMDPVYPTERLDYLLRETEAPVLVTMEALLDHLPDAETDADSGEKCHVVCLDADWGKISLESQDNPVSGVSSENLAYVIFTSGSTGQPKGTLIQHRGLCNIIVAQSKLSSYSSDSRQLQFLSFSFDGSIVDFFPTLISGAVLVFAPREVLVSIPDLRRLIQEQKITHMVITPSILAVIPSHDLPTLQTIFTGGEASTKELVSKWVPGRRYANLYGPTETTVVASYYSVEDISGESPAIPIGRPYQNVRLYILDRYLRPVPVGIPGELYIGGAGTGRGYLRRPVLTAENFIPDPFSIDPGDRLYKTGDQVKFRVDGNIEFMGRIDHQVKIRGFRIELGEIESALGEHPGLEEVVVVAWDDANGIKRLAAYVIPSDDEHPSIAELRSFLEGKLPDYMVPSFFMILESFPLNPSGKVERHLLPDPDMERSVLTEEYVAPRNEKEKILAKIWADVLGIKQVGVYDNFFELGGDSILSIQVVSRVNQSGLRLSPKQIFQNPTIEGLAGVADTAPVIQAEQGIVEGSLPLTPIQRWFFENNFRDVNHWNQSILVEVKGSLQEDLLKETTAHLTKQHDALRMRFEKQGTQWIQLYAGLDAPVPFAWVDLSTEADEQQAQRIETISNEVQASLNLTAGPLLRVVYFNLGQEKSDRLLMVLHHLVVDGVSWRILMDDFLTIYQQLVSGTEVQLPPKTTSFKYWAERLVNYANSDDALVELSYWSEFSGITLTPLPADHPHADVREASGRDVQKSLNVVETQALLQEVPTAFGTEINDALLMALLQTITQWSKESSLLVELEGHGREDILEDVDISRTVGWFTTIFPVQLQLIHVNDPGQALIEVKEQLHKIPGRGIGYGLLRYLNEDENVKGTLAGVPHPEVSFNYLGQVDQSLAESSPFTAASESKGAERSLKGERLHKLMISGNISQGRLQMNWSYSANLYDKETIDKLAENYMQALRDLIDHTRALDSVSYSPSDFEDVLLDQDDIDDLLDEIGGI